MAIKDQRGLQSTRQLKKRKAEEAPKWEESFGKA